MIINVNFKSDYKHIGMVGLIGAVAPRNVTVAKKLDRGSAQSMESALVKAKK